MDHITSSDYPQRQQNVPEVLYRKPHKAIELVTTNIRRDVQNMLGHINRNRYINSGQPPRHAPLSDSNGGGPMLLL
jgi:hypothetical protein